jgi:bifunctional N-acetylglucosamine-1-phosphate-uridyltransferase/glucosamine-1-phosphate-acetyltransferase GlmU-like protein
VESGFSVEAVQTQDAAELFGVNSMKDLERAEQFLAEQTQSS